MKKLISLIFCIVLSVTIFATNPPDEGMWLPMFVKDYNYADMQRLGLKLTPEQLYDINHSSLKDAIVQLGNFCTAEVVSQDGLILTNHHCGYSSIAEHSTAEHDYLKDGFWAMSRDQELPNEGLTVTFLVRMDDVTQTVLAGVSDSTSVSKRSDLVRKAISKLQKDHSEDGKYDVVIKPFFGGNEYYMFVYQIYKDVRLVGAPPSGIGKFGGDTDNWVWPRHTGDFSMFRIYSAPDGSPATYSKDNVPLKPKHSLPISLKGVKEGDFSMIWGFPGSTERFMTSYEVKNTIDVMDPAITEALDILCPIIRDNMNASDKIRLLYADHYASLANMWKNKHGEALSLKTLKVADKKAIAEEQLQQWVNADAARKAKYDALFTPFKEMCENIDPAAMRAFFYANMILMSTKTLITPYYLSAIKPAKDKKMSEEQIKAYLETYQTQMKETDPEVEAALVEASLQVWKKLPANWQPDIFTYIDKKFKGNLHAFAQAVVYKSIFSSEASLKSFLQKPNAKTYSEDPSQKYMTAMFSVLMKSQGVYTKYSNDLKLPYRKYLAALKEMKANHPIYPDANSTMRMTYGSVLDYYPADGVHYLYYTTAEGILEKEKPGDPEFDVPAKLHELIVNKDFGKYALPNGKLPVCFLSNNDITGGNSGSPVLNANGEMIGIAFDGNWEALSSDIVFNTELQRCINVDIRYVLFVIDKFAGATHLIREMDIRNE